MPGPPATVGSKVALELEAERARLLRWAGGGGVRADVLLDPSTTPPTKRLGSVSYRDIILGFTTGMSRRFYQLVADFLDGTPSRCNGAVVEVDLADREVARTTFTDAVTTELTFPALVASSTEPAQMTLTLPPAELDRRAGAVA